MTGTTSSYSAGHLDTRISMASTAVRAPQSIEGRSKGRVVSNSWNVADWLEVVSGARPGSIAQIHGERAITYEETEQRSNAVARWLVDSGLQHDAKFAQYLYNSPEYLECFYAALKVGMVPVNINYRYQDTELQYVFDNADAEAIVFHGAFTERLERLRPELPKVRAWLWVDDNTGPRPAWAADFNEIVAVGADKPNPAWARSGNDIYMQYTGGTTGMPKGVMWRQNDMLALWCELDYFDRFGLDNDPATALRQLPDALPDPGPRTVVSSPLMHGTGLLTALDTLLKAGTVITLPERKFDAHAVWATVAREHATSLNIVGDPFAKPLLSALDAEPNRWELDDLREVTSSGAMWTNTSKQGLLRHIPHLTLIDSLGSTESTMGMSVTTSANNGETAKFELSGRTIVVDENHQQISDPGVIGRIASRGTGAVGYYKDPDKTAATFPVINGERYTIGGDWAELEADGTIRLLGRGSVCINTGGEKVFPEEVEVVACQHPAVADAAVVGIADDRFGEVVAAAVQLKDGAHASTDDIIEFVRARLAGYKVPRRIVFVDSLGRGASAKLDYKALRALVIARTSTSETTPAR
ncbi:AMP-binding protein [Nocardia sp. NPDC055049]